MFSDARERAEGYIEAMRSHGLEPVVLTTPRIEARAQFGQFSREMAVQVLHHPSRATGVVAYNDYIAQGLAKGLMERGAGVPEDFSIVGSDDLEIAALSIPSLTTLSPPIRQCGRIAAEMIFQLMEKKNVEDRVLSHELVVRESTRDMSGDNNSSHFQEALR